MIHVPEGLQLRSGRDPHYVSIDVDGKEIGHLVIHSGRSSDEVMGHAHRRPTTRQSRRPCLLGRKLTQAPNLVAALHAPAGRGRALWTDPRFPLAQRHIAHYDAGKDLVSRQCPTLRQPLRHRLLRRHPLVRERRHLRHPVLR